MCMSDIYDGKQLGLQQREGRRGNCGCGPAGKGARCSSQPCKHTEPRVCVQTWLSGGNVRQQAGGRGGERAHRHASTQRLFKCV